MNGHILPELPIAVDHFRHSEGIDVYFLTHMHSDHTVGLTKWWSKTVYCSSITATLLHHKLQVAKKFIEALEELRPHGMKIRVKSSWIPLNVTLIPANHCPGSCMFLFETKDMRILYTGDFRPNKNIYEIGRDVWGPRSRGIDTLYLDNTYCEPSCDFPSRENVIEDIVALCKSHSNHRIYVGISWTGHEELLERLAAQLQSYIVVTPDHMEVLKLLDAKRVFTTDKTLGRIFALPRHMVKLKFLEERNSEYKSIGVLPTARTCNTKFFLEQSLLFSFPYSNHSSFTELWEFVRSVCPRVIKPIVPARKKSGMESHLRADLSRFGCLLSQKLNFEGKENRPCRRTFTYDPDEIIYISDDESPPEQKPTRQKRTKLKRKTRTPHKPYGVVFDDDPE